MPQDGGWIQLLDVPSRRICARAHLMVNEVTAGGWHGRLESVHTSPLGSRLAAGDYIALFGPWTEPHLVEVADGPTGFDITSDGGEPSILRERSHGG